MLRLVGPSIPWACLAFAISINRFLSLASRRSCHYTSTILKSGSGLSPLCPAVNPSELTQAHSKRGKGTTNIIETGRMSNTDQYKSCNLVCLKDLGLTKETDVIIAGRRGDATEHVLFFGGDLQDYPEQMMSHRDNGQYVRWNSLATAALLCQRFPSAMVMVIKPHHMHLKTFSVYSQFVESSEFGNPTHSADYGAWKTLHGVYHNAVQLAVYPSPTDHPEVPQGKSGQAMSQTEAACKSDSHTEVPLHLIGFSRGCIVLNQLVYELEHAKADKALFPFVSRVRRMTWLDGGHSGGSNTWVTDPKILQHLVDLSVDVTVHVTPYQMEDPMRKWIGREKRKFVDVLVKAGAKVSDNLHFEDLPASIDNHFRVLEVF